MTRSTDRATWSYGGNSTRTEGPVVSYNKEARTLIWVGKNPRPINAGGILAMKKRSYCAQKVNEVRWEEMADRVKDKAVVWAIDVAKVE
jgi:hypothetical protein